MPASIVIDKDKLKDFLGSISFAGSVLAGEGNVVRNSNFNHPIRISGANNILMKSNAKGLFVDGKDNFVIDSNFFSNADDYLATLSREDINGIIEDLDKTIREESKLKKFFKNLFPGYLEIGIKSSNGETYYIRTGK